MQPKRSSPVIAIFCADLHLSETAPVFRSAEEDWFGVQLGYVTQLRKLQERHKAPIFIAGDLFNKWNSTPLLINSAIEWFSGMDVYAVAGNHDVPNHNMGQIMRSAYWTLVKADVIHHLFAEVEIGELIVHPFGYGREVIPPSKGSSLHTKVALVHSYIWTKTTGYPQSVDEERYASWLKRLDGYDVAVFGDNHQGFLLSGGAHKPWVCNCGTLMRRTIDEKDYAPFVGLLCSDGTMVKHQLDCGDDKFLDLEGQVAVMERALEMDLTAYTEELKSVYKEKFDFVQFVLRWVDKQDMAPEVKSIILTCIGRAYEGSDRR